MTGKTVMEKLLPILREKLPECEVREAFAGRAARKPDAPAVVLELLEEIRRPDEAVPEIKLGAVLYTPPDVEAADLFSALCAALAEIGAPVRSVAREKLRYDSGLGCFVAECVVRMGEKSASESGRETVTVSGKRLTAKSVKVTQTQERREYGEIGEADPHTVHCTETYTIRLTDLSGTGPFRFGELVELEYGGMRYTDCAVREMGAGSVVLTAEHAERSGEAEDGGI